jgi:hypothetical protein
LFWVDDRREALAELAGLTRAGGLLCLIILSQRTAPRHYQFRRELFDLAHTGSGIELESFEELAPHLADIGFLVEAEHSLLSTVRVPWLASDGHGTATRARVLGEAPGALEFLLRRCWRDVPAAARRRIDRMLTERAVEGEVPLRIPEVAVLLRRTA